jgi:hypothetical protein
MNTIWKKIEALLPTNRDANLEVNTEKMTYVGVSRQQNAG